jgi:peptidoglycan/xylan/chitin deacetylase (PgdA/CDA1 family)
MMKKNEIRKISHLLRPLILAYHGISKKPQFNCITESLFRDQISWLKENYSVISLAELVNHLTSHVGCQADLASITFDDGYVNFAELAVPILEHFGCHATVFVPTGKVGFFNDWDEDKSGFHRMPIMSFEQLRQLPEKMVEVGSHGISHIGLNLLARDVVAREIIESQLELEQGIGKSVRFFAFPFEIYPTGRGFNLWGGGRKLLSGYSAACTGSFGRFNSIKNIYTLRRIAVWEYDSFRDFVDKLEGDYDWLIIKEKIGRFYKSFIPVKYMS